MSIDWQLKQVFFSFRAPAVSICIKNACRRVNGYKSICTGREWKGGSNMQEKNYTIRINEYIHIVVFFKTDGNRVMNFVVKIEYFYRNKWLEVERYDCYH